jgi:hypothetical protein
VHGTTFVDAQSLSVDLSIANNAALGFRSATVTNADGGAVTRGSAFQVT